MSSKTRKCNVSNCTVPVYKKKYCTTHYNQYVVEKKEEDMNSNSRADNGVGLDDMILLPKISIDSIYHNIKIRYNSNIIYTYIGNVLISINPFKKLPLYDLKTIHSYIGKYPYEVVPHVYSIAESSFRSMLNEEESQSIIISGESGAGKTEVSKQIMQYIAVVSGKSSSTVEHVKNIIIESNPLLEAFGNAKTLRNNNSSRFGKYFEIKFDLAGQPQGGAISNYLLEKSRIVYQQKGERNYHIFYQLVNGAPNSAKKNLRLTEMSDFNYINVSNCYEIDGVNDESEFELTRQAMKTIGMGGKEQEAIFTFVAAILHIGNIKYIEEKRGSEGVKVADQSLMDYIASLLKIDGEALSFSLTHSSGNEEMDVVNNDLQATVARDALAKSMYAKLFDWLVQRVNSAIVVEDSISTPFSIGVLDIYGFEIFNKNGFEQFCINFVNEKLQQIFIQLTLQQEQEEYVREGIEWTPIQYFNNRIVCELIEGSDATRTPGIFAILDDVCFTMHAVSGADKHLVGKLSGIHASHAHFISNNKGFVVKHYAGDVNYDCLDFADKNKDTLTRDIINVIITSTAPLVKVLFEDVIEEPTVNAGRKRPTTAGFKIKQQVAALVKTLSESEPHYVRCIKPNDEKKANCFTDASVQHQITYLGLLENVKVKRAGFASRIEFPKFLERFALCCSKTWPSPWTGDDKSGCKAILKEAAPKLGLKPVDAQLGKTKLFLKHPETLFALEELKNSKLHSLAAVIQRAWRFYKTNRKFNELRIFMADFLTDSKERRRNSLFRPYRGEYLSLMDESFNTLRSIICRFEKDEVEEEVAVNKRFRVGKESILFSINPIFSDVIQMGKDNDERVMVMTKKNVYFFGYLFPAIASETNVGKKKKKILSNDFLSRIGPGGQFILRIMFPVSSISSLTLSNLADDYLVMHTKDLITETSQAWLEDNRTIECMQCKFQFTVFNRRHHCRVCGLIFCDNCSSNYQQLPTINSLPPPRLLNALKPTDRTPWQKIEPLILPVSGATEVHRTCDECFGKLPDEKVDGGVLLKCDKKTEFVGLLVKKYKEGSKKNIAVNFSNSISFGGVKVSFAKKSSLSEGDTELSVKDDGSIKISVAEGLSSRIVAEKRAAEEKRRIAREEKSRKEQEFLRRRNEERELEREEERKLRIQEKKARKAEQRAREAEAESSQINKVASIADSRLLLANVTKKVFDVPVCNTCGCNDFLANPFKPGKCNHCFHPH